MGGHFFPSRLVPALSLKGMRRGRYLSPWLRPLSKFYDGAAGDHPVAKIPASAANTG